MLKIEEYIASELYDIFRGHDQYKEHDKRREDVPVLRP